MKKKVSIEIIVTFITMVIVGLLGWYIYKECANPTHQEIRNNECAYIGGITVGIDSIKAVDSIRKRLTRLGYDGTQITFGDSIGYYLPQRNESYYIVLDDKEQTVNRVYFHSDSLTDAEIDIIARGNRYSRHKTLYHKGNKWVSFQDGNGTFIIHKE